MPNQSKDKSVLCSVPILTLNAERFLGRCLKSLRAFSDVYLLDGNSTDRTHDIADEYGAHIFKQVETDTPNVRIKNFTDMREKGITHAKEDWLFFIDSDEYIEGALGEEIEHALTKNPGAKKAWYIQKKYSIGSKKIEYAFNYPNYYLRLWHKQSGVHFQKGKKVHEQLYLPNDVDVQYMTGAVYSELPESYAACIKKDTHQLGLMKQATFGEGSFRSRMHSAKMSLLYLLRAVKIFVVSVAIYVRHGYSQSLPFGHVMRHVRVHLFISWWRLQQVVLGDIRLHQNQEEIADPDFFVVGLQKSGTYWVTALLNAHPDICCFPSMYGGQTGVGEGRIFDMLASIDEDGGKALKHSFTNYHDGFFADLIPRIESGTRQELYDAVRVRYSAWCQKHKGGKRLVGDKTTEYIFHLGMIDSFYPNVKKICIIRDPKDRIVSWYFHQKRKGRLPDDAPLTTEFVESYCRERIMKEYAAIESYEGDLYGISYASLHADPHTAIEGMLHYLGVDASKEMIERMHEAGSLHTLRKKDTLTHNTPDAENQLASSHYRKGTVGDWKEHLSDQQAARIDDLVGAAHIRIQKKFHLI